MQCGDREGHGGTGKGRDSAFNVKVESVGPADGLHVDVRCERGVQNNSQGFGLSCGKDGAALS